MKLFGLVIVIFCSLDRKFLVVLIFVQKSGKLLARIKIFEINHGNGNYNFIDDLRKLVVTKNLLNKF